MDFALPEDLAAAQELCARILSDKVTHERQRELYKAGTHIDAEAWQALADAGLTGLAFDEADGGAGLGYLGAAVLMVEVGRAAAPVPALSTIVMTGLALAEFGTDEQKSNLLPGMLSGSTVATAALVEYGAPPAEPTTVAKADSDGWKLSGQKVAVPNGMEASVLLVPARTGETTVGVFIVDADAPGLTRTGNMTNIDHPEARLDLVDVTVGADRLLGTAEQGSEIVEWILLRTHAAQCVMMAGACDAALRLAAEYTQVRQQFDRPIATFQAVSQRVGDGYIDNEAVHLTAWQAAWRISAGLPAETEVAIAKYWAGEGGHRVTNGATHVHGGVGVDRDYPLHRYFLLARHTELTLGGPNETLANLGAHLAAEPV